MDKSIKTKNKGRWLKIRLVIYIIGAVLSLCVLLFPLVSDIICQIIADTNISEMSSGLGHMNQAEKDKVLDEAHKYNNNLFGYSHDVTLDYNNQLAFNNSGIMSYIEIPKISIKMPVYHGTNASVLMNGVGHIDTTSLPVGGPNTHCVLSAHSGMSTMRAFDDLNRLEQGDKFTLWTLSDPYCYEVQNMEVVEPWDTASLSIKAGEDLCTLVTCTPYGINTHRLLVHGKRCEYEDASSDSFNPYLNSRTIPLIIGVVLVIAAIAAYTIYRKHKKQNSKNK